MNQLFTFCDVTENKLAAKAVDAQIDLAKRTFIKDARKIIVSRGAAILGALKIVEHKQAGDDRQRSLAVETTYSFCKNALQLREIFKTNCGY